MKTAFLGRAISRCESLHKRRIGAHLVLKNDYIQGQQCGLNGAPVLGASRQLKAFFETASRQQTSFFQR